VVAVVLIGAKDDGGDFCGCQPEFFAISVNRVKRGVCENAAEVE